MKTMVSPEQIEEIAKRVATEVVTRIGFRVEVVESLPEVGQNGILYLIESEDPDTENIYDEYVWISSSETYEKIGSTAIDLSGYVDLTSEQTISGLKIFDNNRLKGRNIILKNPNGAGSGSFDIRDDNGYNGKLTYGNYGFIFTSNMVGAVNNGMNLGTATAYYFGTIFTNNLGNPSGDTISIADLANLITYAKAQGWIS